MYSIEHIARSCGSIYWRDDIPDVVIVTSSPGSISRMNSAPQYERHYPIYQGKYIQSYNNPSGLTEVVIGCAGNIEGHENTWQDPIPGWCAYVEQMVAPVAAALVAAVRDLLRHVFTVFTTVTITATES